MPSKPDPYYALIEDVVGNILTVRRGRHRKHPTLVLRIAQRYADGVVDIVLDVDDVTRLREALDSWLSEWPSTDPVVKQHLQDEKDEKECVHLTAMWPGSAVRPPRLYCLKCEAFSEVKTEDLQSYTFDQAMAAEAELMTTTVMVPMDACDFCGVLTDVDIVLHRPFCKTVIKTTPVTSRPSTDAP